MPCQAAPMTEQLQMPHPDKSTTAAGRLRGGVWIWARRFDPATPCASMEPAQNQTLAQGLQYVLIIGSAFGRRPEWQAVQNGRWRCINLP
jgi:hypothetical protein